MLFITDNRFNTNLRQSIAFKIFQKGNKIGTAIVRPANTVCRTFPAQGVPPLLGKQFVCKICLAEWGDTPPPNYIRYEPMPSSNSSQLMYKCMVLYVQWPNMHIRALQIWSGGVSLKRSCKCGSDPLFLGQ